MITMKELEAPVRQWVPDWLGLIVIFAIESSGGVPPGDLHTEGTHYGGALKTAKF